MALIKHILITATSLAILLGLPAIALGVPKALMAGSGADALSGATIEVPEKPSGDYYVFLNCDRHESMAEWEKFFRDEEVDLIMEDIACSVCDGDVGGLETAEHFMARLAENQMQIKSENGLFLMSKLKSGIYDAIIISKEAAKNYALSEKDVPESAVTIKLSGGAS